MGCDIICIEFRGEFYGKQQQQVLAEDAGADGTAHKWEKKWQFIQNDVEKGYTLNGAEIAICGNQLYLVLQNEKKPTIADLYYCDLVKWGNESTKLHIERIMTVRKTAFFE